MRMWTILVELKDETFVIGKYASREDAEEQIRLAIEAQYYDNAKFSVISVAANW